MPLIIPPSKNYPSPLVTQKSLSHDRPIEGRKQIACEILWGSMGGPNRCVSLNVAAQGAAAQGFSQISMLKVDNSGNSCDVTFIFPDTQETIVIPLQTPFALVPVMSNSLQFFVSSPNTSVKDITRFQILNYVCTPTTVKWDTPNCFAASITTVWVNAVQFDQLIPAGTYGILQNLYFETTKANSSATDAVGNWDLFDGEGNLIFNGYKANGAAAGNLFRSATVWTPIRFHDGLAMRFTPVQFWIGTLWVDVVLTWSLP
jgi:hypothetical protein